MRATASGRGRRPDGQHAGDGVSIALIESGAVAPGIDPAAGTTVAVRPRKASKQSTNPAPVGLPVIETSLGDLALEANEQRQNVAPMVARDEQMQSAIELEHIGEMQGDHQG
jgi:hypothetical protein